MTEVDKIAGKLYFDGTPLTAIGRGGLIALIVEMRKAMSEISSSLTNVDRILDRFSSK